MGIKWTERYEDLPVSNKGEKLIPEESVVSDTPDGIETTDENSQEARLKKKLNHIPKMVSGFNFKALSYNLNISWLLFIE